MKYYYLLLILSSLLLSNLSSAEVRLAPSSLMARLSKGKISIEFCEMGTCRPLGKAGGYRPNEWQQIDRSCRRQALYFQPGKNVLQTIVSLGAALAPGHTKLIALAGMALTSGQDMSHQAMAASRRMNGVRQRFHFTLSLDEFVELRDGIKFCNRKYDESVRRIQQADLCSTGMGTPTMGCY